MKIYCLIPLCLLIACNNQDEKIDLKAKETADQALVNISQNVYYETYIKLDSAALSLYQQCQALESSKTDATLITCKASWLSTRRYWEYAEAWLFGPVSTESIDPSIDTWPIDYKVIQSMSVDSIVWSDSMLSSLESSSKGFHPIEFILWGIEGNKTALNLTSGELHLLTGLAKDLYQKVHQLKRAWSLNGQAYLLNLTHYPNSLYSNLQSVLLEILNAQAGICDEVANGKISEVMILQDRLAVESPFSGNSMNDFKHNIEGVEMVYTGDFALQDGKGISDIVKLYNLDLNRRVIKAIDDAKFSLSQVSLPFEQAIYQQPVQLQNAVDKINALEALLSDEVVDLIKNHF